MSVLVVYGMSDFLVHRTLLPLKDTTNIALLIWTFSDAVCQSSAGLQLYRYRLLPTPPQRLRSSSSRSCFISD